MTELYSRNTTTKQVNKKESKQPFLANGNKQNEIVLKENILHGEYKQYDESESLQSIAVFEKGNQMALTSYFSDGSENIVVLFGDNGVKKEEKIFNENGKIICLKVYGSEIDATYYHENVESQGKETKTGFGTSLFNKTGIWTYYHENGSKKKEGEWAKGGRHGKDNIQIGLWKFYDEAGELVETLEYNSMGMEIKKN